MQNRVLLKNVDKYTNGFCLGRIIAIKDNRLYLSDKSGVSSFLLAKNIIAKNVDDKSAVIGDIVRINFENENVKKIIILNRVKKNPVGNSLSPFYRLNKNNNKLKQTLHNRQKFFRVLHDFFYSRNFIEVHTPTLVESPGIEEHIEPFITNYTDYSGNTHKYYLPTSPEFSLKEALSSGLELIYEIKKVFRNNGENSALHMPEFFMVEWYRAFDKYTTIMQDVENLLQFIDEQIYNNGIIKYKEHIINIKKTKRIKLKTLFASYNINLDYYTIDTNKFRAQIGKHIAGELTNLTNADLFFKFFLEKIEPNLGCDYPTIVYDYPIDMCNLSKRCEDNPLYGERFELYIASIEIANAFGELINPIEQKARFKNVLKKRESLNAHALPFPKRFLRALEYGIPPSSGIALGVERLFMLFEGLYSIQDTNFVNSGDTPCPR